MEKIGGNPCRAVLGVVAKALSPLRVNKTGDIKHVQVELGAFIKKEEQKTWSVSGAETTGPSLGGLGLGGVGRM